MQFIDNKQFLEHALKIVRKSGNGPEFGVENLAIALGISKEQLLWRFKSSTGMPPWAFIRNYRLESSIDLLKKRDVSVTDVSSRAGFRNPSYFSRCFKRTFGCTPSEYRRRQWFLTEINPVQKTIKLSN
ncbi:MAG: helix-turn-helix transcriptional regulator [Bacteroidetes bacterium]|nr:helix-turn-helix transcriptional regulator [Bacteroidota bacterium]